MRRKKRIPQVLSVHVASFLWSTQGQVRVHRITVQWWERLEQLPAWINISTERESSTERERTSWKLCGFFHMTLFLVTEDGDGKGGEMLQLVFLSHPYTHSDITHVWNLCLHLLRHVMFLHIYCTCCSVLVCLFYAYLGNDCSDKCVPWVLFCVLCRPHSPQKVKNKLFQWFNNTKIFFINSFTNYF